MSDFLYARPSFIGGACRVLDLFGTLQEYNKSLTPEIADARAMFSDFGAIGADLEQLMKRYEEAIAGGTLAKRRSGRRQTPSRAEPHSIASSED